MKVVLIIGGAVSGSTAARKLTENGVRCVIVDQNRLPYGKIDGMKNNALANILRLMRLWLMI